MNLRGIVFGTTVVERYLQCVESSVCEALLEFGVTDREKTKEISHGDLLYRNRPFRAQDPQRFLASLEIAPELRKVNI